MPVGPCAICDIELDHTDAGFCYHCKRPFCWVYCGDWHDGDHVCEECQMIFGDDEDE